MTTGIKLILGAFALSLLPTSSMAKDAFNPFSVFQKSPERVALYGQNRKNQRIQILKKDAARIIQKPPRSLYGETALGCIAVAVYHEARNQSIMGQKAVASVIVQRSLTPNRWGETPCEVVIPVQFEFMKSRYGFEPIENKEAWILAVRVALTIMYEGPMTNLQGADHYHATYVSPKWRLKMDKVAQIGAHIFYADPMSTPFTLVQR